MANRFRKVYIVCRDNKIFDDYTQITIYKSRDSAEFQCKRAKMKAIEDMNQLSNVNKPLPQYKVHAFFLVHEDMFRD